MQDPGRPAKAQQIEATRYLMGRTHGYTLIQRPRRRETKKETVNRIDTATPGGRMRSATTLAQFATLAVLDEFSVLVPSSVIELGMNVIAIQAVDREVFAYFDARLAGNAPTPKRPLSWGS